MNFSDTEILTYALPAVFEAGKTCFGQGRVKQIASAGESIIAGVSGEIDHRVVLTPQSHSKKYTCACNCQFAYGGVCEHVVAVMLALRGREVLQTDLFLSGASDSAQPPPAPVVGDVPAKTTEVKTINDKPVGRLYLSEREGMLYVELRFSYHQGTAEFTRYDLSRERIVPVNDNSVVRIVRSRLREDLLVEILHDEQLEQYRTGIFVPLDDPADWLRTRLSVLAAQGFEIYGRENLRSTVTHERTPRLSLSFSGEGESVSCLVDLEFDGVKAALPALVTAVQANSHYVMLSDGSSGVLPQTWLAKFAALFAAIEPGEAVNIIMNRFQLGLFDELLEVADEVHTDPGLQRKLTTLKDFTGIQERAAPEGFVGVMRPYQQAGYAWFYFLQEHRFGGCLADDMGLGKTVQTLALLLNEKNSKSAHGPSLIVVPASLIFNWEREARTFAPTVRMLTYHGPGRKRYNPKTFAFADIVLTTYGTLLRDINMLEKVTFHYIILDEAQAIKNPGSHIGRAVRRCTALFRLALSGTPIENSLYELWSLFTFLNPGMLGSLRSFSTNYIQPINRDPLSPAAQTLKKIVFPFILRRTKEQVATELPPKTESLILTEMLPRQKTLYDIVRESFRVRILDIISRDGMEKSEMQILEGLLRLRQICCHPQLMDPNFTGESGKFQLLDSLIEEAVANGHKILLFSQFVKALEIMQPRLSAKKIRSVTLTGQTRDRQAVVDQFQNEKDISVFCISLKAGGTGLNLTAADYVIHLEPWWNPAVERQASDRAYRIGQARPVFVYKIIMKETIEERVLELQERKKELTDSIIQTEGAFFKKLTRGDIEGLFS
jgi:non-specific serine/threonine protein kinase